MYIMDEEYGEWHGLCHLCNDDIDSDNCSWLIDGTTPSTIEDQTDDVVLVAVCSRCAFLARQEREGYV